MGVRSAGGTMRRTSLACVALALCTGHALAAGAPVTLKAHFDVIMTHVEIGELTWTISLSDDIYRTSAHGKASGMLAVLVKGEGSVTTEGTTVNGRPVPTMSRAAVSDEDGAYQVRTTFNNGMVTGIEDRGARPPKDRVHVTKDLLQNVADPLSAMLIPYGADAFARTNCAHTLRIFDGRRRYNLALSYKRLDKVKLERGYSGKVLVCKVVLHPLAGYKVGSLLVRYLAGKGDLEMWFAPIAGVPMLAPVRALMPTLIGTMDVRADAFEAVAVHAPAAAPAQVKP